MDGKLVAFMKKLHNDKYEYIIPAKPLSKLDPILILCKSCKSSTTLTFREHLITRKGCRKCDRKPETNYYIDLPVMKRCQKCELFVENCVCS